MRHTVIIDDSFEEGKTLLDHIKFLLSKTPAVTLETGSESKHMQSPTEVRWDWLKPGSAKITLDNLLNVVDEEPLLSQLKAYRDKGVTDLRLIAKELALSDEDKEDLVMLIRMKENNKSGFVPRENIFKKRRTLK